MSTWLYYQHLTEFSDPLRFHLQNTCFRTGVETMNLNMALVGEGILSSTSFNIPDGPTSAEGFCSALNLLTISYQLFFPRPKMQLSLTHIRFVLFH